MASRATALAPTAASLPDAFRIPSSTASLIKSLGRLSRASLINIALQWLHVKHIRTCRPYLRPQADRHSEDEDIDDPTNPYPAADSIEELIGIYETFRERKGAKREVIDRILEGDWRHGLSLRQIAMADVRYIEDHPAGHRWTALQLESRTVSSESDPVNGDNEELNTPLPQFHAASFIKAIQREISPLVKAHYHVYRLESLPLTLVRILVIDSPFQYPRQASFTFTDATRLIYIAFPDSTPFVYSSVFSLPGASRQITSSTTDTRTLRKLVRDAIPKALSRPEQRYTLKSTSLTTKNLHTLLSLRGPWRTNSANGAFTIFADAVVESDPLDPRISRPSSIQKYAKEHTNNDLDERKPMSQSTSTALNKRPHNPLSLETTTANKKQKKEAIFSRFGTTGESSRISSASHKWESQSIPPDEQACPQIAPNAALDRLQIHLRDPVTPEASVGSNSRTTISLNLSGSDVITGLRRLAELGMIDAARMPSWMTGEEGVSSAIISNGRRIL